MSKKENNLSSSNEILSGEEVEYETITSKRNIFFWAMYDLANTIYSMVIVSLIINRYVLVIGQLENSMTYGRVNFLFGVVSLIMQVGIAICVPILGALSDNIGKRKPFVISLTGIILLFTSLLGFFHDLTMVLVLYVIANVAYQFSLTFYDAMLPFIAKREDIGKVAGFGVAWGYLGTILALVIMYPLIIILGDTISTPPVLPEDDPIQYGFAGYWFTFVIPMILFLICTIPFLFVREKQKKGRRPPIRKLIKNSFSQLLSTFKDIRKHRSIFIFIIGYFFVADVANVIVLYMTPIVTDGLHIAGGTLFAILFIIIATMSAVIFTYYVGKFGDKYGAKKTFYLVGAFWGIALTIGIILIFSTQSIDIGANLPFILSILMGIIAGPALGGNWVAQRIMIIELAPKEKFGEFFGFSKLSGKFSSALGPFVWGSVMLSYDYIGKAAFGWALISVGIIMGIGILIISFIKSE